jgi:hypothetical protein
MPMNQRGALGRILQGGAMPQDERDILAILRRELEYIEKGGYGAPVKDPTSATSTIFADSLTCLNYGYPYRTYPCAECPLIDFVPPEKRATGMPCHEIPLDATGRTVEQFAQGEDQQEMQEIVKGWLRQEIQRLEFERMEQGKAT